VTRHPEQVRTLVAHEPPLATVLPDREEALAVTEDIHEAYERDGLGPAMAKFIAFTSVRGPTPPDFPNHAPNPADVGLPTEDDGSRDHPLLGPPHGLRQSLRARLRLLAWGLDANRRRSGG
jgi:hypothetical protein